MIGQSGNYQVVLSLYHHHMPEQTYMMMELLVCAIMKI